MMNKRDVAVMLFLWTMGFSMVAQASVQESAEKVDYAAVHQNILSFEAVMSDAINSTFSSNPLSIVQKPKGVYLDGYGLTFTFLINIHTAVIHTPFGAIQRNDMTPEAKNRRIEELKDKLIRLLLDNPESFRQLRKEDWITVVAYIEDRNIPDEPNASKTVVLSTLKKNLDELGHKTDRLKEFKLRMKIVEY